MKPRVVLVCFGLIAAANLVSVAIGNSIMEWITKPLLMPVLAVYLIAAGARRRETSTPMLVGLGFAAVADTALLIDDTLAFLIGMGFFLVMQVAFITAFCKLGAFRRVKIWTLAVYLVVYLGYIVVMVPRFGDLAVPILVYSLALTSMAVLASGMRNLRVAVGGGLFLLSDLMIGLGVGNVDFASRNIAVMETYVAAQFLIVTGWLAVAARKTDKVPTPE